MTFQVIRMVSKKIILFQTVTLSQQSCGWM